MDCPHPECKFNDIMESDGIRCPECGKGFKICLKCNALSQSFARFCRECKNPFNLSPDSWPVSKGNVMQTSVSSHVLKIPFSQLRIQEQGQIKLPNRCRILLISEGYLFAVSGNGEIVVTDILAKPFRRICAFNTGSNLFATPALSGASLYVGTEDSIQAYSLGILMNENTPSPRWVFPLTGTPVKTLLPFENHLYFTQICADGQHQEIQCISNVETHETETLGSEQIHRGSHISSLAAQAAPKSRKLYFLSAENGKILLHSRDHTQKRKIQYSQLAVKGTSSRFIQRIPPSVIANRVFAVFEEEKTLLRLDADSGNVNMQICKNVNEFALANMNEPVITNARGVYFKRVERQEAPGGQGLTATISPVIFREYAAAFAMNDSSVYIYELKNPGTPLVWNIAAPTDTITAMAASKNMLAVGTGSGLVKICSLV